MQGCRVFPILSYKKSKIKKIYIIYRKPCIPCTTLHCRLVTEVIYIIYDFKNPEHFKALERQTYDGVIDVSGFPPAAYRYFDSLRLLYARYKYDNLSNSEAAARKKKLLAQYNEAVSAYEYWTAACKYYQENIRKAGTRLSDMEKSADIFEALSIAAEIIEAFTNDRNFAKRIRKKYCGNYVPEG